MSKLEKTSPNKPKRNDKGQLLPGETSNPKGRPKGTVSITEAIKRKLAEIYIPKDTPHDERNKIKRTHLEAVVDSIFHNALENKDARSLKDIWNYIDGLPKATIGIDADKESLEALTEFFRNIGGKK